MTNEEAITMMQVYKEELAQRVDNIKYDLELRSIYLAQIKAFDMAIHALRQPPNDDWERYSDHLWKEAYNRGKQEALKDRPQGEWIVAEHQDPSDIINGNLLYICSNCGVGDLHDTKQNVPYCWHCGADMRGDTDDKRNGTVTQDA